MTDDKKDQRYREFQEDRDQAIPTALRLQQMDALDVYYAAAKDDDTVRLFLLNVSKKLNKILQKLDVPFKDEA